MNLFEKWIFELEERLHSQASDLDDLATNDSSIFSLTQLLLEEISSDSFKNHFHRIEYIFLNEDLTIQQQIEESFVFFNSLSSFEKQITKPLLYCIQAYINSGSQSSMNMIKKSASLTRKLMTLFLDVSHTTSTTNASYFYKRGDVSWDLKCQYTDLKNEFAELLESDFLRMSDSSDVDNVFFKDSFYNQTSSITVSPGNNTTHLLSASSLNSSPSSSSSSLIPGYLDDWLWIGWCCLGIIVFLIVILSVMSCRNMIQRRRNQALQESMVIAVRYYQQRNQKRSNTAVMTLNQNESRLVVSPLNVQLLPPSTPEDHYMRRTLTSSSFLISASPCKSSQHNASFRSSKNCFAAHSSFVESGSTANSNRIQLIIEDEAHISNGLSFVSSIEEGEEEDSATELLSSSSEISPTYQFLSFEIKQQEVLLAEVFSPKVHTNH